MKRIAVKSLFARLAVFLAGLLIAVLALECGLRAASWLSGLLQRQMNLRTLHRSGQSAIRILCLGDSTTAIGGENSFPAQLSGILSRQPGLSFEVFNQGRVGSTSLNVLVGMQSNLRQYKPHIVVTMMGIHDAGIVYFRKSAIMWPDVFRHSRVFRLLQLALQEAGEKFSHALGKGEVFRRESHAGMLVEKGFLDLQNRRIAAACDAFSRAMAINPREDRACIGLGLCYAAQRRYARAESLFKKAVEIKPGNLMMYLESKWGYRVDPRYFHDEGYYRRRLDRQPDLSWALTGLAMRLRSSEQFEEATQLLERAIALEPSDAVALLEMGMFLCSRNEPASAAKMFVRAKQADPLSEWPYVGLAWCERMTMDMDGLEQVCRQAIEKNPFNPEPYGHLSWCYQVQGRYSEAEQVCRQALGFAPESYWPWLVLGYCAKLQKDYPRAIAAFSEAVRLNPEFMNARMELGMVYAAQGKRKEAIEVFQKALADFPDSARACAALATLYEEENDTQNYESLNSRAQRLRQFNLNPVTVRAYRALKQELDRRGILLVCVQYPMRSLGLLKEILGDGETGVFFVDNERSFREAVSREGFSSYFEDMFAGDFGHCTAKGNRLLAENVAQVILGQCVWQKQ
mgnify:CR=1 FL=1